MKTIQVRIDKQKKINTENGRELAEHHHCYPSADYRSTDSKHNVNGHLYSLDFPSYAHPFACTDSLSWRTGAVIAIC